MKRLPVALGVAVGLVVFVFGTQSLFVDTVEDLGGTLVVDFGGFEAVEFVFKQLFIGVIGLAAGYALGSTMDKARGDRGRGK